MLVKLLGFLVAAAFVAFQWPSVAMMIGAIILLVLVHEFGHWFVAKLLGFQTPVFSVGVGPRSWSIVFGNWFGTEWRLSPVLIGGYVSIPEIGDESTMALRIRKSERGWSVSIVDEESNEDAEEGESAPNPPAKRFPVWKRIAVAAAGVVFNVLFSVVLTFGLFACKGLPTTETLSTVVASVETTGTTAAHDGGLKADDMFVSIGGKYVVTAQQVLEALKEHAGKPVEVVVERNEDEEITATITPASGGDIGVKLIEQQQYIYPQLSITDAAVVAVKTNAVLLKDMVVGLGKLVGISKREPGENNEMMGVIGIVNVGAKALESDATDIIQLIVIIGLNLALMNILPIPMLDGGHILFFAIEGLTGKKLPAIVQMAVTWLFAALLLAQTLFFMYSDLVRILSVG